MLPARFELANLSGRSRSLCPIEIRERYLSPLITLSKIPVTIRVIPRATGIQIGEKIHYQLQVIWSVNLSTKKIRNNIVGKLEPTLVLDMFASISYVFFMGCNH